MYFFGRYSILEAAQSIAIGDLLFSIASLFVHLTESYGVQDMGNHTQPSLILIHHSSQYVHYATHVLCWIYMGANAANILLAILLWQAVLHENIIKTIGYLVLYPALIITGFSGFLYHSLVLGPSPFYYGMSMYPLYYSWKIYTLFVIKAFLTEIRSHPTERRRRSEYGRLDGSRETLASFGSTSQRKETSSTVTTSLTNDRNDSRNDLEITESLPKSYEIPPEKLKLDHQTCLDSEEFYATIRGVFEGSSGDFTEVAVKTLKVTTPTIPHAARLLQEAKVMAHLSGGQENILKIFGVCTKSSLKDKLFMVMEYYPKGSLDAFLQDCVTTYGSQTFRNLIDNDGRIGASIEKRVYENVPKSKVTFDTTDLLKWAYQTASAMEYLHTKRTRFPWRWTALECVIMTEIVQFGTRTDVWSYGIFLYELFTLGEIPYGASDSDIVRNLSSGMRLEQPKYATQQLYQIMLACWRKDPIDRPNFALLKLFFQQLLLSLKAE